MKKKKLFIIIGIVIVIIALIVAVFVFSNNYICEDGLTLLDEITLNDEEKEVLFALKDIDNELHIPNTKDFLSSSYPISIHALITNIYEVRKFITTDGEIDFLIDADIKLKTIKRRILLTTNGHIDGITLDEDEINENRENSFYVTISYCVHTFWENSATYENVDYNKMLKKI